MPRTSTYLNFARSTEEAFRFYATVFGHEIRALQRFREMPAMDGAPPIQEADLDLLVHVELEILGGHVLKGTDAPESMGFKLNLGNNVHISLEPDTFQEARALMDKLSVGGQITMPLQPMFWGAAFASFTDQFGLQWMLNCPNPTAS
jgi:PhnB protein